MTDETIEGPVEGPPTSEQATHRAPKIPRIAVMGMGAVIALFGLLALLGGAVLYGFADPERIADLVEAGAIETGDLTEAETIDVVVSLAWWGSTGLVVTGLLLLLGGLLFVLGRRSRSGADLRPTTGANAVIGAFVTVVFSFVPASPILGGAVSGYLQRSGSEAGAKVGGLAGLLAALPVLVLLGFSAAGLAFGLLDVYAFARPWLVVAVLVLGALVGLALVVILGGVGGVVGNYVATELRDTE